MDTNPALDFTDPGEWRRWLEQNHGTAGEARLVIYKKNSRLAGIRYDEALEEALCFGWIDGVMRSIDDDRFYLRFSPRNKRSIWSLKNKRTAEQLMEQGRMTAAGLEKIDEARSNGLWEAAYTSNTRHDVPPDLERELKKNKAARDNFRAFAPSYRNTYVRWILDAKTEKTRMKRIKEVVRRAAENVKPGLS